VAAIEAAVAAEQLGYDSIWVADHLMHGHDGGILEGWTTLSVIAGRTSRVKLGTIHLAQPFRAPALVAALKEPRPRRLVELVEDWLVGTPDDVCERTRRWESRSSCSGSSISRRSTGWDCSPNGCCPC
jgi:hypothetical protein